MNGTLRREEVIGILALFDDAELRQMLQDRFQISDAELADEQYYAASDSEAVV
jgi:hypothetical protein